MTKDQVDLQTAWEKVLTMDKELESLKWKHNKLIQEYAEFRLAVEHHAQAMMSVVSGS